MMSVFLKISKLTLLLACLLAACAGAKGPEKADPLKLLAKGSFKEARAAVQPGSVDPKDRAIIALSLVAEKPVENSAEEAVAALTNGLDEISAAAAALELLDLIFIIPSPVEYEVSMLLTEVALGSVGQGAYSPPTAPGITVGAASRSLAISVLERTHFALSGTELYIDSPRLLFIWNACFTLTGGSFATTDDGQAWRLYRSIGGLAITMSNAAPDADLTSVLLGAAVGVIESNPSIVIAARCDLGSPFDQLKSALAHEREILIRLEKSVVEAKGCSRGTYAPETK